MIKLTNFPKLECPFVRKTYKINRDQWKAHGRKLQLRKPEVRLVTTEINPEFNWVFEDVDTVAVEKLDGTCVKLLTENGRLVSLYNRKNPIDMLDISGSKGRTAIVEGIFMAVAKGYIEKDGEQAGEVIGRHINGNPYKLSGHLWYPFSKMVKHLTYRSWHEHERTYDNLSLWFKEYLFSRYAGKLGLQTMAEGVVFYNLKRKEEHKRWRAKLRRDMFGWYYDDLIEIYYDQIVEEKN